MRPESSSSFLTAASASAPVMGRVNWNVPSGAADITPDVVFAQSNAAVIQQVAAGSAHISTNSGLVGALSPQGLTFTVQMQIIPKRPLRL